MVRNDKFDMVLPVAAPKVERRRGPRSQLPQIRYPVLSEEQLATRWSLSGKTLQRWRVEGIGPPSWHIGKAPRYLESQVDAFERNAQVVRKSAASGQLLCLLPAMKEDAIKWSAKLWAPVNERILLDCHEISCVTGLPTYWFGHRVERSRLGIPHYVLGGKAVRFCVEQVYIWELDHIVPRVGNDGPADL